MQPRLTGEPRESPNQFGTHVGHQLLFEYRGVRSLGRGYVELIGGQLAASIGDLWTLELLAAASCLLLPLACGRSSATWAALDYLVAAFVVTLPGHFPVSVFGACAAPVLGWYALLIL